MAYFDFVKKVVDTLDQFSILRLPNGEQPTVHHPAEWPFRRLFDSSIDVASESKHRANFCEICARCELTALIFLGGWSNKSMKLAYETFLKSLILAQNERWRRGLGMQVVRERPRLSSAAKG